MAGSRQRAVQALENLRQQQAESLAYFDVFWLAAVLGVALGLFFSAFARTEFQAVQFMPLVVFPQIFLCGLFAPRDQMAGWMQALSMIMPLTYAVQGLQEIGGHAETTWLMWRDLIVVAGCIILALSLAAATLRRRTD